MIKTKIKKSEIKDGHTKSFDIGENKIVICNVNGEFFAVDDICSHDDGVLVSGDGQLVEICQIECPRHGARFDVKTGEAKKMPAVAPIKTYKVNIIDDELEINIEG